MLTRGEREFACGICRWACIVALSGKQRHGRSGRSSSSAFSALQSFSCSRAVRYGIVYTVTEMKSVQE